MKCLMVYQHLPHYRQGVFKALDESTGIRFEFASDVTSRGNEIPTMSSSQLKVFHRLKNRWIGPWLWQRGLLNLVLTTKYDCVVFLGNFAYVTTWMASVVCRLRGVRVVFWTIGWHSEDRGVRRLVRRSYYRLAHELMLYGNVAKDIGRKIGYPESRMTVIGNSHSSSMESEVTVSPSRLEDLRAMLPDPGTEAVGAVIRLNPEKRLDLLIRATAVLSRDGRKVVVVLAGTGPEAERLKSLADQLGVDVRMLGACYGREELELCYQRLKVTVVPVYAGLTAIQSMKFGRPVITSDNGYNQAPESECIRPGVTGELYRDGSVDSLAEKISVLLNWMRDGEAVVGERCRTEIEANWSVSANAEAISRVLTNVRAGKDAYTRDS